MHSDALRVHSDALLHGVKKVAGKAKGIVSGFRNDRKPTASATTKQPATREHRFWRGAPDTGDTPTTAVVVSGSRRERIKAWVMDHMEYVGNLWDETGLNKRLNTIVDYDKKMRILFRT